MTAEPADRPVAAAGMAPAIATFAVVVFIVYGSLYPFNFSASPLPLSAIFSEWNPFGRSADAADNILLFVPLGLALHFACGTAAARWLAAVLAWATLGVALQWLQLYLPGRVASVADALNNAAGLALGFGLAALAAPALARRQLVDGAGDRFAWFLVAAWYVYESFPFVPTLDIGLLAGHIKPIFDASPFEIVRLWRHALAATLGAVALLAARPFRSRWHSLAVAAAVLIGSETLVPYGDLRSEALFGIVLGLAIGERLDRTGAGWLRWAVATLGLLALMTSVFTPMRNTLGVATSFTLTPFSQLLWQGTSSAIPVTAFEALGVAALLWGGVRLQHPRVGGVWRRWHAPALVLLLVVVTEWLRHVLPTGGADTTTLAVAVLLSVFALSTRQAPVATSEPGRGRALPAITERADPATAPVRAGMPAGSQRTILWTLAALLVLSLALYALLALPGLPYNVRELFPNRDPARLVLFSAALLWLGAAPWFVARLASLRPAAVLLLPLWLALAGLTSLALLRWSVPQESLDDITGSSDLYRRIAEEALWGVVWQGRITALPRDLFDALERGVRYVALYGLLLAPMTLAAASVKGSMSRQGLLAAFLLLAPFWWLAQWIVIDAAITDNLTELIAHDGRVWLGALILMYALHVVALTAAPSRLRCALMTAFTVIALPLGWWLLLQGLEQVLTKYDAVWSAQQFLLGRDRTSALSEQRLFARWCLLYLGMLGIGSAGMALARRAWPLPTKPSLSPNHHHARIDRTDRTSRTDRTDRTDPTNA